MTHLLFLPDDQTFILLDSPLPAGELASSINTGQWIPPPALVTVLQAGKSSPAGLSLKAVCFGKLVIATLTHPLDLPFPQAGQAGQSGFGRLSPRQNQVLQCLIEGLTTHQIALRLGLHPRTVQYHITHLKIYFQAGTRAESIGRAVGLGLFKRDKGRNKP
jgi:DNA-binding CsgD family transcriptional regulator